VTAPTLSAGGPYAIAEGQGLSLHLTGASGSAGVIGWD